jgi:hypothetical protein
MSANDQSGHSIARNYYQCKRHPQVLFWFKAASSRLSVAVPVMGRFPKELFPIGDLGFHAADAI